MKDDIRKAILEGTRQPNGNCVTCGQPTCKDNRFLCQGHHYTELMSFIRRLSQDVLSTVVNMPFFDKYGNCYEIYPSRDCDIERYNEHY